MLKVALGDPLPGDPLPEYKPDQVVDYEFLLKSKKLIDFSNSGHSSHSSHSGLFLTFFELRELMRFKQQRDQAPGNPQDLNVKLIKTLGLNDEPNFDGLTQVNNIDDLYNQRTRQEVKDYIRDTLRPGNFDDFVGMMQIKVKTDNEWKEINRLLELAGQRKRADAAYRLELEGQTDFNANFGAALNYDPDHPVDFASLGVDNIDEYYAAFQRIEDYFYMSAEDFSYIMAIASQARNTTLPSEWGKVYDILAAAYRVKVYDQRRVRLKSIREEAPSPLKGVQAIIQFALVGDEPYKEGATMALEQLGEYVLRSADFEFLETIEEVIQLEGSDEVDWARVYRIVELAQRNREALAEPVVRIERWINLHSHADATAEIQTDDPDNPHWKDLRWPLASYQRGTTKGEHGLGHRFASAIIECRPTSGHTDPGFRLGIPKAAGIIRWRGYRAVSYSNQ